MKYRDDNDLTVILAHLVHRDVRQAWHDSFTRAFLASRTAHEGKRSQKLQARENAFDDGFSRLRAILCDPMIDAFQISERQIVKDKPHPGSRLSRSFASA